jgi:hypothetical protein
VLVLLCCLAVAAVSPAVARADLQERLGSIEAQLDSYDEDLEDDGPAMGKFTLFDECAFLIGVSSRPGYRFTGRSTRSALSFDLSIGGLPAFALLAFPAEEPPGIECNEDAEPENTDDG